MRNAARVLRSISWSKLRVGGLGQRLLQYRAGHMDDDVGFLLDVGFPAVSSTE